MITVPWSEQKTGVSGVCVSPEASPSLRLFISSLLRRTTSVITGSL